MSERDYLCINNTGIMSVYRLKQCYDRFIYQIYTTENIVEKIKEIQDQYDTYHTSEILNNYLEEARCLMQITRSLHFPYWSFLYDTIGYRRKFMEKQIRRLMGELCVFDHNIKTFCKKIEEFVVILDNQYRVVRIILQNPPPRDLRLVEVFRDITSVSNIQLTHSFE